MCGHLPQPDSAETRGTIPRSLARLLGTIPLLRPCTFCPSSPPQTLRGALHTGTPAVCGGPVSPVRGARCGGRAERSAERSGARWRRREPRARHGSPSGCSQGARALPALWGKGASLINCSPYRCASGCAQARATVQRRHLPFSLSARLTMHNDSMPARCCLESTIDAWAYHAQGEEVDWQLSRCPFH